MRAFAELSRIRLVLLGAAGGGVVLGVGAWLTLGSAAASQSRLQAAQDRLEAARPAAPRSVGANSLLAAASQRPLFALTTGPGAVAEVALSLDGVARTPRHTAALLSINGAPDIWLDRGKSASGVTLVEVGDTSVTVETALGQRQVQLIQGPPTGQPAQGGATAPSPPSPSRYSSPILSMNASSPIPPGMHLPPPPASAPTEP